MSHIHHNLLLMVVLVSVSEVFHHTAGLRKWCPIWGSFSNTMNRVASPIQAKFITPPTKPRAMKPQQQPTQKTPMPSPMRKPPANPARQLPRKYIMGEWHTPWQTSLARVN